MPPVLCTDVESKGSAGTTQHCRLALAADLLSAVIWTPPLPLLSTPELINSLDP